MPISKQYRYYIGIDTGVNTGFCLWDKQLKKVEEIKTVKIHWALNRVYTIVINNPLDVFIRVEDARLRKIIPWKKDERGERGRREGAGYVKRDAVIWEDFLTELKANFEMVAPKDTKTKITADYFKNITGYSAITSQHARDAGMLVVGF